jgi:hypothetical protein
MLIPGSRKHAKQPDLARFFPISKVGRDGLWFLGMRYMDPTLAAYVGE